VELSCLVVTLISKKIMAELKAVIKMFVGSRIHY